MKRNLSKIKARKRLWDIFGWSYPEKGKGFFHNSRSLNCGCAICKGNQDHKRRIGIKRRLKMRREDHLVLKELLTVKYLWFVEHSDGEGYGRNEIW